jgi:hypothetical protein
MTYDMLTVAQRGPLAFACKGNNMKTGIHEAPDHLGRRRRFGKAYEDRGRQYTLPETSVFALESAQPHILGRLAQGGGWKATFIMNSSYPFRVRFEQTCMRRSSDRRIPSV